MNRWYNRARMHILGIDPGIGRTGWGIITVESSKLTALSFGCIETKPGVEIPQRLLRIYHEVIALIQTHNPDALAIEELFFNTNTKTAFTVGQARGVILLAAAQRSVSVTIYTPLQVKMATTGYGRAEKAQVGQMVKVILKLPTIPKPDDTADALAIAITHAFSRKMPK